MWGLFKRLALKSSNKSKMGVCNVIKLYRASNLVEIFLWVVLAAEIIVSLSNKEN